MIALRSTRRTFGRHVAAIVILGAFLPCLAPRAQRVPQSDSITGTVRDEQGRPVAGARIELVDDSVRLKTEPARDPVRAESDARGAFVVRFMNAEQATRRLSVRRIGFTPLLLDAAVDDGRPAMLAVRLRRVAAPLDAVVVNGRRDVRGPMAGFYTRREMGHGRFFTSEDVQERGARRMTDLLRGVPGLRLRARNIGRSTARLRGSTIAPLVWLDGVPMSSVEVDLDTFDPRTFAGIEVYSGAATVPVEFAGGRAMSTSGGTIVLWSRQGEVSPRSRKRGEPSPATVIARLLERGEAFTADQVSVPARPLGQMLILPHYPDSLYDARVAGHVEVEFVVDATGRPRMDTFGIVSSSHASLVDAVRRSLVADRQKFTPAMLDGRPVAQLVQQPFEFRLDDRVTPPPQRD